jgi:glyoxylase-like metal-dependent hydrolase (beta-lactamase superfamily II)
MGSILFFRKSATSFWKPSILAGSIFGKSFVVNLSTLAIFLTCTGTPHINHKTKKMSLNDLTLAVNQIIKTGFRPFNPKIIVYEYDWNNMKHKTTIRCEVIHPHIHRVVLPLPGRQPGPVNVYLFTGKQTTLLDTGTSRTARHLEESLRQIGIGFADIDRIILTHGHIDHYGAARHVVRRSSGHAVVAVHREDRPVVETGMEVSDRQFSKFYRLMGVPLFFELLFYGVGLFFSSLAENCRVDLCLSDGEKIPVGDYEATVISTPGYAKGFICLYLEKEGILFFGDHILGHITPNALSCWNPILIFPGE